jgi:hypothetical protein
MNGLMMDYPLTLSHILEGSAEDLSCQRDRQQDCLKVPCAGIVQRLPCARTRARSEGSAWRREIVFLLVCNYGSGRQRIGQRLGRRGNSNGSSQAQGGSAVLLSVVYELNLQQHWRQKVG